MRSVLPLMAAILASSALAAAPAFAQQGGSSLGDGSSGRGAKFTHLPPPKPKAKSKPSEKAAEPAQSQAAQPTPVAQTAPAAAVVLIDPSSTYNDALRCYQFHGVAMQIAKAMEGRANLAENQKAQYESVARMSGYLQAKWFQRIGELNTSKKGPAELNADLQSVAGSVVVDANAGLGGDKDAQARNDALKTQCKTFETVQTQTAAPADPTAKPG